MSQPCIPLVADHYPVEKLPPGWMTANVKFRHRNGVEETRTEIINLKTQKRYLHEPLRMTAFKCFELTLGIPFYSVIYMAWNVIKVPLSTGRTLADGVMHTLDSKSCGEVFQRLFDTAWTGASVLFKGIWTVVRAPFYALQMFFGAVIGMFNPLVGRAILEVEGKLHEKPTRNDIFRHPVGGDGASDLRAIWEGLSNANSTHTAFLSYCMQPLGKTTDPHLVSVNPVQPENPPAA